MKKKKKETIGRLEIVDLPKWDIKEIEAKIDTGAYSSSLHCHNIKEYEKNGAKWVKFNLLDPEHPSYNERLFSLPVSDIREVKSSNGQTELRVFVKTKIIFYKSSCSCFVRVTNICI